MFCFAVWQVQCTERKRGENDGGKKTESGGKKMMGRNGNGEEGRMKSWDVDKQVA